MNRRSESQKAPAASAKSVLPKADTPTKIGRASLMRNARRIAERKKLRMRAIHGAQSRWKLSLSTQRMPKIVPRDRRTKVATPADDAVVGAAAAVADAGRTANIMSRAVRNGQPTSRRRRWTGRAIQEVHVLSVNRRCAAAARAGPGAKLRAIMTS